MKNLLSRMSVFFVLVGAFFAGAAFSHPGHDHAESAPWYRYLPPGAPQPSTPQSP
jgi:hypothetical protein